jgi:hypothetical protein
VSIKIVPAEVINFLKNKSKNKKEAFHNDSKTHLKQRAQDIEFATL